MKTFYITLKAFYFLLLAGLIFGTISCADKIEAPSSGSYAGMIVYTKYDRANKDAATGVVVDTSGIYKYTVTSADGKQTMICNAAGGKILYITGKSTALETTTKLIIAGNDNSGQKVIYAATPTQDLEILSPVLSPDGEYVAFATTDSAANTSNLWVTKSDGTVKRLISSSFNVQTKPCFSQDSKQIAYYTCTDLSQSGGQSTIEMTNVDLTGSNTICAITRTGVDGEGIISWKNGANEIAFTDGGEIFNIDVNSHGQGKIRIDSGATPMWSPDGYHLAYFSTNSDLVVTTNLGFTKTDITNTHDGTMEAYPQWSADGNYILYMSWNGDFEHVPMTLKLADLKAGTSKTITTPGVSGYFLK